MIFLGILGFTAISLVGVNLVEEHVEGVYSGRLYREATKIAGQRAVNYYREFDTPAEFSWILHRNLLQKIFRN